MIARIYLSIIGLMYVALAAWCSMDPATTSHKVGFDRLGGSGRSEFLVIYGGLELGMALIFLMPWVQRDFTLASLWACILIHACLVVFRTASFFMYDEISSLTYKLAVGEWIILLSGLGVWYWFSIGGISGGNATP